MDNVVNLWEKSQATSRLFAGCCNMIGPLSAWAKQEILSYLNDPTEEQWDAIYSILVTPEHTLWQAWLMVDSDAPRIKPNEWWPTIPAPDAIRNGMRLAVQDRQAP